MFSAQRDIRKTGWKKSLWFWLGNFLVVVFSSGLLLQAHAAQTVYAKATKLSNKPGWPSGCPSGAFLNTADAGCYKCPSGYSHNPLKFATTGGVCYKRETRKGDEWSCLKTERGSIHRLDQVTAEA